MKLQLRCSQTRSVRLSRWNKTLEQKRNTLVGLTRTSGDRVGLGKTSAAYTSM